MDALKLDRRKSCTVVWMLPQARIFPSRNGFDFYVPTYVQLQREKKINGCQTGGYFWQQSIRPILAAIYDCSEEGFRRVRQLNDKATITLDFLRERCRYQQYEYETRGGLSFLLIFEEHAMVDWFSTCDFWSVDNRTIKFGIGSVPVIAKADVYQLQNRVILCKIIESIVFCLFRIIINQVEQ